MICKSQIKISFFIIISINFMAEQEERFDEYQSHESPELQELKKKLLPLFPKNSQQVSAIVAACKNIDTYKKTEKLINDNVLKCDKKKTSQIKTAIQNFYDVREKNDVQPQGKENDKDQKELKQQLLAILEEEIEGMGKLKTNIIQNLEVIEKIVQSTRQKMKDEVIRQTNTRVSKKKILPLKDQLYEGIKQLLESFVPAANHYEIPEAAEQIVKTLEFEVLHSGELRFIINQISRPRVIAIIQNFKSYTILSDYDGNQIQSIREELKKDLLEKLSKESIPFKTIKELINKFIEDPFYNWTDQADLNDSQKSSLVQILWIAESRLKQLMKLYKIKEKLNFKIAKDIKLIVNHIVSTCKIALTSDQVNKIKQYLEEYNLIEFFECNQSINAVMKNIYEFMKVKCPDYMNAQANKEKCTVQARIEKQLLLKSQLFMLIEHFSYKNWKIMEEQILKGNINIINKYIQDQRVKYEFRKWANENLRDFFQLISQQKTTRGQAQNELITFFVSKNIRSLTFSDIITLTQEILENPYYEVIEAATQLTQQNIRQLKQNFTNLKILTQYNKSRKIELPKLKSRAQAKIENEINQIINDKKIQITYTLKDKLIQEFLDKPYSSTIYEQKYLTDSQKKDFMKAIGQIQQVKEYIKNFDLMASIKRQQRYLKRLEEVMMPADIEKIKPYIFVLGQIPISKDEKYTIQIKEDKYREINEMLNNLPLEKRKILKIIQNSVQFKQFKEELVQISTFYKKECKEKFILLAKKIIYSKDGFEPYEQQQLIQMISSSTMQNLGKIFSNKKQQKYLSIKTALEHEIKYQNLLQLEVSLNSDNKLFKELQLNQKIRSSYHHQSLMSLDSEAKSSLINQLQARYNKDTIKKCKKLTQQNQESLIEYIQSSNEFKSFYNVKTKEELLVKKDAPHTLPSEKIKVPFNPEQIKQAQKKQVVSTQVQQNQNEIFVDVRPFETQATSPIINSAVINPSNNLPINNPPVVKPYFDKESILKKWDQIMFDSKDKSQFKNARSSDDFKQKPLALMENIFLTYPWTEDKLGFWTSGRPFMKKGLIGDLTAVMEKQKDMESEIKMFQSQS